MNQNSNRTWFLIIAFLIFLVAIFHYTTSVHLHHWHELYGVLFFIPIILAAFRYQLKGGVMTAFVIIVIYLPHVMFQWGGDFLYNFSRFLEMVMYLVIGIVTGLLAQREQIERRKYQQTAAQLEKSYQQLKAQSDKLMEIEEQLLHAERLSVLGELSASLAHEVRNPLASIWGVVEILQQKLKAKKEDAEFTEILVKEVNRLNEVVENYLTLSRKSKPSLKKCDLHEIVQSVVLLLKSKALRHNIEFNIEFPEQPIFIQADENQLRQILINLMLNAMAATPDKSSIMIKAEFDLSPTKRTGNQVVHLSVIDSGQGMGQVMIDKIFNPFYTTKEDGTGLGLSIVKRIMDQNKWQIQVQSEPGQGTTITLIFPLEAVDV